ncbi:MAG: hypothetical protein EPO07_15085 [Verrucomicrobia bacterium]|nr:MAG: hypothetical protein EPO07_15085 [Verrucomicrobiota bacterium]
MFASVARAHDPYEITSTANLFSNRTELDIEMEYRTARLLAGLGWTINTNVTQADEFATMLPKLNEAAGAFFDVTAGRNAFPARETNVTLGVENHVKIHLVYPPAGDRPLRFVADGLKPLANEGPYGSSLIVLDRVRQKVLAQSVLFAATPVAEVPARSRDDVAASNQVTSASPPIVLTNFPAAGKPTEAKGVSQGKKSVLPLAFIGCGLFVAGLIFFGMRRNRK